MIYVMTGLATTAGNFLWQLVYTQEWGVAAERTYFQLLAIGMVALFAHLDKRDTRP